MNDILKNLKDKLKNGKVLLVLGMVGILLICASSFFPSPDSETETAGETFNVEEYRERIERDIKKTVKSITGSNDITVLLTLDGGKRYSYGYDGKTSVSSKTAGEIAETNNNSESNYLIITDSSGNEKAVPVYEYFPEIRGVAIVYSAPAGASEILEEKIKNAVIAALGITSKRINIVNKGGY